MPVNSRRVFKQLAAHFVSRSADIAHLASMASMDHWFHFEAAAYLSRPSTRQALGLTGKSKAGPKWSITCEFRKIDLLLWNAGATGLAIEFKAIHNNKNFRKRVREVRSDLTKSYEPEVEPVSRSAIAIVTFAIYEDTKRYVPLRVSRRGEILPPLQFRSRLEKELSSEDAFHDGATPARVLDWRSLCSLDESPFVVEKGGFVALALIGH